MAFAAIWMALKNQTSPWARRFLWFFSFIILVYGVVLFPALLAYFLFFIPSVFLTYVFIADDIRFWERFILAVPLSGFFQLFLTSFSSFGVSITKTTLILFLVVLPFLVTLLFFRKHLSSFVKKIKEDVSLTDFFSSALIFLLTLVLWGPLLQSQFLPLSDAVNNQAHINEFYDEISTKGRIPLWTSRLTEGITYTYELSFHYIRIALFQLLSPHETLTYHQNGFAFFSLFLLLLGIFFLAKRLSFSSLESFLVVLLFITNPFFSSKFGLSGDIREMVTFVYVPAALLCVLLIFQKKLFADWKPYAFLGILAAVHAHAHIITFIYHFLAIGVLYCLLWAFRYREECSSKKHFFSLFIFLVVFVGLLLSHYVGFVMYYSELGEKIENTAPAKETLYAVLVDGFLQKITKETIFGSYSDFTGRILFFAGLVGLILCFVHRKREGGSLLFLFFGLLIVILFITLANIIFNVRELWIYRFLLFFVFLWTFLAVTPLLFFRRIKSVYVLFIVCILLFSGFYGMYSMEKNKAWVREVGQNMLKEGYQKLFEQSGAGRVITYGLYSYGLEPAIPQSSQGKLWMVTHTITLSMDPQRDLKDGDEDGLSSYPVSYILNRYQTTFTTYILINRCDPRGKGAVAKSAFDAHLGTRGLQKLSEADCLIVYHLPSNYIEKITPFQTTIPEKTLYAFEGSARGLPHTSGKQVSSENDTKTLPEPIKIEYLFVNRDHLILESQFSEGDLVHVKDHYHPRWNAYMDGKKIPVDRSYFNTLLLKPTSGTRIHVIHEISALEKSGIFLSLLTTVLLLFFILKKGSNILSSP